MMPDAALRVLDAERRHPDQDVSRVRDARVREHALDVALHERNDVAQRHGRHREHYHDVDPLCARRHESHVEQAQERGERRRLHRTRHVAGHRRRRALIHVGYPHVERHRADLEDEADQYQSDRKQKRCLFHELAAGCFDHDALEVHGSAQAVHDRHSVQEEGDREGAQKEVLHGRFVGEEIAATETDDHVDG